MSGHRNVNLPGAVAPRGYSDATLAAPGRLLLLGGHVAFDRGRKIRYRDDLVSQLGLALRNLRMTIEAAGGDTEHLVKLTIYTTDVQLYRSHLRELGLAWREALGPVYPAATLIGVRELFDEGALVEVDGMAVLPDEDPPA